MIGVFKLLHNLEVKNKDIWKVIVNKLLTGGVSEEDDLILFGSSIYEENGNDFDICLVFKSFFNIQYLMHKIEYVKKILEEELNKNIDIVYLFAGDIKDFAKNSMIFNLIIRTGISVNNIDYSKHYKIPDKSIYNSSDSRLKYSENIIQEEFEKELPHWEEIENNRMLIIKEISVRMTIDNNIHGYNLYQSYKRHKYLLEKIDLNNLLNITDEIIKEGEGLIHNFQAK